MYLQGKSNLRWAMAARSKSKLEVLRSDLAKINPAMKVSVKGDPMLRQEQQCPAESPNPVCFSGNAALLMAAQQWCLDCVGRANLDS